MAPVIYLAEGAGGYVPKWWSWSTFMSSWCGRKWAIAGKLQKTAVTLEKAKTQVPQRLVIVYRKYDAAGRTLIWVWKKAEVTVSFANSIVAQSITADGYTQTMTWPANTGHCSFDIFRGDQYGNQRNIFLLRSTRLHGTIQGLASWRRPPTIDKGYGLMQSFRKHFCKRDLWQRGRGVVVEPFHFLRWNEVRFLRKYQSAGDGGMYKQMQAGSGRMLMCDEEKRSLYFGGGAC